MISQELLEEPRTSSRLFYDMIISALPITAEMQGDFAWDLSTYFLCQVSLYMDQISNILIYCCIHNYEYFIHHLIYFCGHKDHPEHIYHFHQEPVKIYRVPRPGLRKNLPEKSLRPLFQSKKVFAPLIFSEKKSSSPFFQLKKTLRPPNFFRKKLFAPLFYCSQKQPYLKS